MNKEAFCKCCNGDGQVDEVRYVTTSVFMAPPIIETIKTGSTKNCPGCKGEGISVRAQQWRDENPL